MRDHYDQHPFRCRLDWGRRGAREAARRGDVVVIVDVLRFTSVIATAVHHGAEVYPCATNQEAVDLAARTGASLPPREAADANWSALSPHLYTRLAHGERIALASLNGGHCSALAAEAPLLLAASLLNAAAVSTGVARLLDERDDLCVTVVACGERWPTPNEDGGLRFAIEDYLAAGAVLLGLPQEKSPEAALCAASFSGAEDMLAAMLLESGSGRELRAAGRERDVIDCSRLNLYDSAPALRDGRFVCWQPGAAGGSWPASAS